MSQATRSRGSRSTSAARSPAGTRPGRASAARSAGSRPPRTTCPTTWSGCCAGTTRPARSARRSRSGRCGRRTRSCHDIAIGARGPVLLPVLRGRRPGTAGRGGRRVALPLLHQEFPATICRDRGRAMTAPGLTVRLGDLGFPFGPDDDDDDRHVEDPQHMRSLAEQAAEELEGASADDVIRWATDTFGDRICITSSMSDAVVIHLASAIKPGIDVVFLDTGYHFPETIGTRDAVSAIYPVTPGERDPLADRRRAGRRARAAAVRAQPGPVLLPAQGRAAGEGAWRRTTRGSPACAARRPRPGATRGSWSGTRSGRWSRSTRSWTGRRQAGRRVHRRERRARQPAGLRRVPVDRLPHLHDAGRGRRGPAVRPLGRDGQDRMRHPRLTPASRRAVPRSSRSRTARGTRGRRPRSASCSTVVRGAGGRARGGLDVRAAFLDHCAPSLPQVLGSLDGGRRAPSSSCRCC